jgi:hypothetical protein
MRTTVLSSSIAVVLIFGVSYWLSGSVWDGIEFAAFTLLFSILNIFGELKGIRIFRKRGWNEGFLYLALGVVVPLIIWLLR